MNKQANLDIVCPECRGAKVMGYTDGSFTCRTCNGTGKVKIKMKEQNEN